MVRIKSLIPAIAMLLAGCGGEGNMEMVDKTTHLPDTPVTLVAETTAVAVEQVPEKLDYPAPVAELVGKFEPAKHPDFVRISPDYTTKTDIYLRKDAYEAFVNMYDAAKEAGFTLKIISATRNFYYQKGIWERKWTGVTKVSGQNLSQTLPDPSARAVKILNYSSMPGTSRHHWGTDIDLNNLSNSFFASGSGKQLYEWLTTNAGQFGFCQVYSPKGETRPDGYNEEKWHWSYMPIARDFLVQYRDSVTYSDLAGFKGAEVAETIDVIPKYVSGLNPECLAWE